MFFTSKREIITLMTEHICRRLSSTATTRRRAGVTVRRAQRKSYALAVISVLTASAAIAAIRIFIRLIKAERRSYYNYFAIRSPSRVYLIIELNLG